jgi:diguanylate cyclase (GGDEF)-like protein
MINSKPSVLLISISGTFLVGIVDYLTGSEIRVFPLYFLPLVYSARYLGKASVLLVSFLSSFVWLASLYYGGQAYSNKYIWIVNFLTQGSVLIIVGLLLDKLNDALKRERANSRIDYLTGLANSRSFFEKASSVLTLCNRNKRPVTLAYVDLDNFKYANDAFGHLHGDSLLRKAAEIFHEVLRTSDVIARMGGDEFAILLPETSDRGARAVLEKVRQQLEQSPDFQICSVTVSIGAISYAKAPPDIHIMIKAADDLMYKAKQTGKNRVSVIRSQ